MNNSRKRRTVPAIRVRQWIAEWDNIEWQPAEYRSEPPKWFYQFSIPAQDLKALSGVYRRTTNRTSAAQDVGIQRRHEPERSREISRFVQYGYPWSNLSSARRASAQFDDLRQPGWLPTAIVVNVLNPEDERRGRQIHSNDLVKIEYEDPICNVRLPLGFKDHRWRTQSIPPIELIDGQHRLWAFSEDKLQGHFEVPVVAFVGLDLSWQAYLFYTINIKPKRINPSIAFDLYPLLRTQEWLTKFEGPTIYRETRAQELVDILWSYSKSPWYRRINMLGEPGFKGRTVTQAAWVRSLMASFVKQWDGRRVRIGGLFGAGVGSHNTVIPWTRLQQAAFLIVIGNELKDAISASDEPWALALRDQRIDESGDLDDLAFVGANNLLNQDQGIRVLLQTVNDLCVVCADELTLVKLIDDEYGDSEDEVIANAVEWFRRQVGAIGFLKKLVKCLAEYDWRSSQAPGLQSEERVLKAGFRGSGGYRDLREHVLRYLASESSSQVSGAAKLVLHGLGYEDRA